MLRFYLYKSRVVDIRYSAPRKKDCRVLAEKFRVQAIGPGLYSIAVRVHARINNTRTDPPVTAVPVQLTEKCMVLVSTSIDPTAVRYSCTTGSTGTIDTSIYYQYTTHSDMQHHNKYYSCT